MPCVRIVCVFAFFSVCFMSLFCLCAIRPCVLCVYYSSLSVCCLPVIFDSCKIIITSNQAALTIDYQKQTASDKILAFFFFWDLEIGNNSCGKWYVKKNKKTIVTTRLNTVITM